MAQTGKLPLEDKVALVTGGARGIGRACALALAAAGADVAVADINIAAAEKTAGEICGLGRRALGLPLDMAIVKGIRSMVSSLIEQWGRIDILVNNAGIFQNYTPDQIGEDDWDRVMDVNLKGTFFCSLAAMRHMKEKGGGRIINLASVAGKTGGLKAGAHYAISKAGVICMTKSLAKDGAPFGILVNAVAPGYILTDMTREMNYDPGTVPVGRLGTPEDVADVVVFLASPASRYITGTTVDVNGGIYM